MRTTQSPERVYYVRDYGAKGDGSTLDTAAVNGLSAQGNPHAEAVLGFNETRGALLPA